jgi:acyl-CoA synthetase (AMP-forming)/AMP-acid ligase II
MLENLLVPTLHTDPRRPLLEFHGQFWNIEEVERWSLGLWRGLMRMGLEPMDRVALLLPNRPETVVAYLACFKSGLVVVPLDYRHRAVQIKYALNHSGSRVLIVHADRVADLQQEGVLAVVEQVIVVGQPVAAGTRPFEEVTDNSSTQTLPSRFDADDLCMMIYTSGTTARPKGVTYTRSAVEDGISKYLARVPMSAEDVALIAAPITRPMALRSQLLPLLHAGGCASLIERFEVDLFIDALQRPPAKTMIALLPAAMKAVLGHPHVGRCDFSALRLCLVGGDRSPDGLHERCLQVTGVGLTEQCGSSEAGPFAMNPPFGRKKPGSIGLPMYGVQVCIVDDRGNDLPAGQTGNIVVRSSYTMDGYWNDTALTRKTIQHGAVQTGDLGRFDEDGYLWFVGRKQDVIVRGGSNISPLEVESAIRQHPAVEEACVVGVTDVDLAQQVHAFVTLKAGASASESDLIHFAATLLADYMVPARIYMATELPLKGSGKVDRDLLRMRAETGNLDL